MPPIPETRTGHPGSTTSTGRRWAAVFGVVMLVLVGCVFIIATADHSTVPARRAPVVVVHDEHDVHMRFGPRPRPVATVTHTVISPAPRPAPAPRPSSVTAVPGKTLMGSLGTRSSGSTVRTAKGAHR